jgi:serine/threonine-protein kinase RIM15
MMTSEFVSPGPPPSSDRRVPSGSSPEDDANLSPDENDLDSLIKKPAAPLSHWAPTIKDFDIIKPISRGAFGKVFLAKK